MASQSVECKDASPPIRTSEKVSLVVLVLFLLTLLGHQQKIINLEEFTLPHDQHQGKPHDDQSQGKPHEVDASRQGKPHEVVKRHHSCNGTHYDSTLCPHSATRRVVRRESRDALGDQQRGVHGL